MAHLVAAYRLAVSKGAVLPPMREAPPVPQEYIDRMAVKYWSRKQKEQILKAALAAGGVIMYDATSALAFPASSVLVASYVDGYGGYSASVARFGAAKCVSISVGNNDADIADVEPGAMTTAELPAWIARQKARGIARPGLYSDGSQYASVLAAGGPSCSYWTANPTGGVQQVLPGRDAVQTVFGATTDTSWVLPSFPWYPGGTVITPPVPVTPWPLQSGSTGAYVVTLQQNLNRWALEIGLTLNLTADGNFGPLTTAAVKLAEVHWLMVQDGIMDEILWTDLAGTPGPVTKPPVVISPPPPLTPPPPATAARTISRVTVTFSDGTQTTLP